MISLKEAKYQNIPISKKESEWVRWYEKGSNNFWEAFYEYEGRKKYIRQSRKALTWFNVVLKGLKDKGLFGFVPHAFYAGLGGIYWVHPGFENSGDFKAEVLTKDVPDYLLTYSKPVI